VVIRPLWSVNPELVDDGDRVAGWERRVCGVHVAGVTRILGAAGLPRPSAEPIGAVTPRPTGPSAASRDAGAFTVAGRRS
jgi:hypothetical protein